MKVILVITAIVMFKNGDKELNYSADIVTHSHAQCEELKEKMVSDLNNHFKVVRDLKATCEGTA